MRRGKPVEQAPFWVEYFCECGCNGWIRATGLSCKTEGDTVSIHHLEGVPPGSAIRLITPNGESIH